jgi:hypothetical protein
VTHSSDASVSQTDPHLQELLQMNKKRKHDSWANLTGDGQLTTRSGNGEQMRVMVSGLGSVSGCPRPIPRQRRHGAYGHKCMQVS